jgi:AhpD family alkylhydroperoxidase
LLPDGFGPAVSVMKFNKKTYKSIKELFADLFFPVKNMKRLREVRKRGLLSPSFQERLMLAVTAVDGCRYCSYVHTKQALKSGIQPPEISRLLSGDIDGCPEEEAIAVMYAQHWADSDAHPDLEIVQRLQRTYGVEKAEAINLMLRMVRIGNIMGNTLDYFIYLISFGKFMKRA